MVSQSLCGDGVYSFDVRASLFGYNAADWNLLSETVQQQYAKAHGVQWPTPDWPFVPPPQNQLNLDAVYSQIIPNSWVVVIRDDTTIIGCLLNTIETGFSSFGLSFKITQLTLDIVDGSTFINTGLMSELRKTTIYAQNEKLTLADLPVDAIQGHTIVLDRKYEGLKPGQIIVVSGECIDSPCEEAPELAVLSETLSTPENRTTLILTKDLKHIYKPETVKINANIALATHGETVQEVLGSGDASQSYQHFALRQPPLTYISAPTPSGAESTLKIRVNDLLWHEVPTLYGYDSSDRVFVTRTNDDGKTTVQFGDGQTGLRLPTGQENVRATYRKGIGLAGNVGADQLSLLMTRPLGVKNVTNPQAASGAADRESLDNARQNAPLTVLTLDRIVSLKDYEDFARAFAGLAKALASWTWDGQTRGVFVTVAGPKGTAISPNSDLYRNLLSAMQKSGDPYVHIRVESYRKTLFRLAVRVKVNPDYRSEQVLVAVEQSLRTHFSFDTRDFGQPVSLSEVMAVIQAVPGVQAVDVDKLYRYGQEAKLNPILAAAVPQAGTHATVSAAELLTLDPGPLDDLGVIQ
jgi:predicted phage baseplate assembly protein